MSLWSLYFREARNKKREVCITRAFLFPSRAMLKDIDRCQLLGVVVQPMTLGGRWRLCSDWLLWWSPIMPQNMFFFPFKSPAVVIDYSCNEKPVPNLVWISLILGSVKSPRKGLVMGYNILSLLWPMSVTQLCVCVCTCTHVCVCAHMSVKGGESKGTQRKQWGHYLPAWFFTEAMETLALFKRIMGEILSEMLNENKCLDAGKDWRQEEKEATGQGCMASPIQRTRVWAYSWRQWRTGKPGGL